MKLWKKILLWFVVLIVTLVVGICIWQCSNILAVWKAFNNTSEEIAIEMNRTKKDLENELQKEHSTIVSDFTAEEEAKIIKGEITYEEAVGNMTERYEEKKKESDKTSSTSNSPNKADVDKLIGDKVVELYSLKAYYLGQLGQIEASVKRDYLSLPKEKRNILGKKTIVDKYMGRAMGLMNECDAKVDKIIKELESGLKALNADTSIVSTIKKSYENEKNLKKAYYLSLMD